MTIAQRCSMLDQNRDCPLLTTALALNGIPSRNKVYFILRCLPGIVTNWYCPPCCDLAQA